MITFFYHTLCKIGRSERSTIQGSVKLRLWLSTREDRGLSEEEDVRNEIKQQQQIFTILLLNHLENFKVIPQMIKMSFLLFLQKSQFIF